MFTSIRGEVFDLSKLTQAHRCVVSIVSSKSILNYGGEAADGIFPVQVCNCMLPYNMTEVDRFLTCLDCRLALCVIVSLAPLVPGSL